MGTDRRDFIRSAALGGAALGVGLRPQALTAATAPGPNRPHGRSRRPAHPLRILILGGTGFIGPWQVRYARERGHEITLFNRGRTAPDMFPGLETLIGDRNGDLESLRGRTWDVVIDNSASRPDWVRLSADFLKDTVDRYYYVSSRSAYSDTSRVPMTSDAPTWTYETAGVDPGSEDLPYGLRKALCEREAEQAMPGRVCVFRPGLIIGPGDPTDRFTYWPVRIHRGGEVLAPGAPAHPVQIIDARDLCGWMIRMAEQGHTGVFTAVGPATPRPMAELLYGIRAVTTAEATFTWVDTDFLLEMGVRPYSHMPVWMPPRDGREGFARFDLSNEVAHGLTFRPLAETARDTLDFHFSRPAERRTELRAGISAEREAEVLAAWHARG
jgi:2'-hydroxyisoflavone reductase